MPEGRWITVKGHAVYVVDTPKGTVVARPSPGNVGKEAKQARMAEMGKRGAARIEPRERFTVVASERGYSVRDNRAGINAVFYSTKLHSVDEARKMAEHKARIMNQQAERGTLPGRARSHSDIATGYLVVTHTEPGSGSSMGPYSSELGPYRTKAEAERAAVHQRRDRRTTARVVPASSRRMEEEGGEA